MTNTLKFKRTCPGSYEARIGDDDLDRYHILFVKGDQRYGTKDIWMLAYPGQSTHDDYAATKTELVAEARYHFDTQDADV